MSSRIERAPQESLRLYEALLLLGLDEETGACLTHGVGVGLAAAVLGDLVLAGKIELEGEQGIVRVLDREPTADSVLDEWLERMVDRSTPSTSSEWMASIAAGKTHHSAARSLCRKGLLKRVRRWALFVIPNSFYPAVDTGPETRVRERIREALFDSTDEVDTYLRMLIAFADRAGILKHLFGNEALAEHNERILRIIRDDTLAAAVSRALFPDYEAAMREARLEGYKVAGLM